LVHIIVGRCLYCRDIIQHFFLQSVRLLASRERYTAILHTKLLIIRYMLKNQFPEKGKFKNDSTKIGNMKFIPAAKYPGVIITGVAFGIFVLLPLSEFASYIEYVERGTEGGPVPFLLGKLLDTLLMRTPLRFLYYSIFGIVSVALFVHIYNKFNERRDEINQLRNELNQGLMPLIAQGENNSLEFKSSYRFDLKQNTVNKALEAVVMKTIAGFMNSGGGTLLLGVSDEGIIIGLENDYKTLKRKDKDGLEQLIMSSVSEKMGTAACKFIRLVFHTHNEMEVCRIIVDSAGFPIYVKDGNSKKFYVRTGSGTRDMDIQEAIKYISENWADN